MLEKRNHDAFRGLNGLSWADMCDSDEDDDDDDEDNDDDDDEDDYSDNEMSWDISEQRLKQQYECY